MDLQISRPPVSVREQVEDKLRRAIAGGMFKPGQRLVERELCDLIGVGRTSIREALRQVEAEGLVTIFPNRGPVVSTLTSKDAHHLYGVRAILEGYAGRMFAAQRTETDLAALDSAYAKLEQAAREGDRAALVASKDEFYGTVLEGCGNPYVKQMLTIIHNRVNLLRATSMTQPGRLETSLQEIRRIVSAVRAKDAVEAEAACVAHIDAAAKVALKVLETNERSAAPDESARAASV